MARISGLNVASFAFSLVAFILCLLVLLAGLRPHVLLDNYFLETDISELNVPSKLSSSTALIDLSSIAGVDYVGSDVTAETLGLAKRYTISLLTTCGRDDDGSSVCTDPVIGYHFDPAKDLKLDGTSAQGSQSSEYSGQLQTYRKISYFLAVAYVIAALCSGLSCILTIVSVCLPGAAVGRLAMSSVAALFLFMASIASIVTFNKLKDAFNSAFGSTGLEAEIGSRVYIISFIAFIMATLATICLAYHHKRAKKQQQFGPPAKGGFMSMARGSAPAGPRQGFVTRVKTWGQQQYQQIEKHPAGVHRNAGPDDDRQGLVSSVENDFSHQYPGDIAMGPVHKKNVNTAYEPYKF